MTLLARFLHNCAGPAWASTSTRAAATTFLPHPNRHRRCSLLSSAIDSYLPAHSILYIYKVLFIYYNVGVWKSAASALERPFSSGFLGKKNMNHQNQKHESPSLRTRSRFLALSLLAWLKSSAASPRGFLVTRTLCTCASVPVLLI